MKHFIDVYLPSVFAFWNSYYLDDTLIFNFPLPILSNSFLPFLEEFFSFTFKSLQLCPVGLMRLKLVESLKLFFQRTISPPVRYCVFLDPLTNALAVSVEATTQGQLICFQPMTKETLHSFPEIRSPRPHPVSTGPHSMRLAPSPCLK